MSRKTKIETAVEKTESGVLVPKTKVLEQKPFYVKQLDSESYAVVSENGETVRVYGSEVDNPAELAEMYAQKMSTRWLEKK